MTKIKVSNDMKKNKKEIDVHVDKVFYQQVTKNKINYQSILNFINDFTDESIFEPVDRISIDDISDNVPLGEAKKMVEDNKKLYSQWIIVRRKSVKKQVIDRMMKQFVIDSFPNMALDNAQVQALIDNAYDSGHSYGYAEVVSDLDDLIQTVKKFMNI